MLRQDAVTALQNLSKHEAIQLYTNPQYKRSAMFLQLIAMLLQL